MKTGKLPPNILKRLLVGVSRDATILIGPKIGEDAAAVRFGEKVLVATTDPITFACDRIGYYAVAVNINDIAVHGAEPRYFLATILLPEGSSENDAEAVFTQIKAECERLGVSLIGGHTEITPTVERMVVCGCMLGETEEGSLISTSGARVGDVLILAGKIAVEGTSILAREAKEDLYKHNVPQDIIERAQTLLDDPGICVLEYARAAMRAGGITSMHDPTEGGIATALRELAEACGHGLHIDRAAIEILDECAVICKALELDPLGLIASGSLLIAADPKNVDAILRNLTDCGVQASVIGEVVKRERGLSFYDGKELPLFERDELARYFEIYSKAE
jgi:hydrogenase maturation factor